MASQAVSLLTFSGLCLRALLRAPKHTRPGSCLQPFGYGTKREGRQKQAGFLLGQSLYLMFFTARRLLLTTHPYRKAKKGKAMGFVSKTEAIVWFHCTTDLGLRNLQESTP